MACRSASRYAVYLSNVSIPSHVRSRFVSMPGKSPHPFGFFTARIHSSPRWIEVSLADSPSNRATTIDDRVQSIV